MQVRSLILLWHLKGVGNPWGTGEVGWEWVWKEEGRRAGIFLPLRDWQGLGE
jgi:hypothetical protein